MIQDYGLAKTMYDLGMAFNDLQGKDGDDLTKILKELLGENDTQQSFVFEAINILHDALREQNE